MATKNFNFWCVGPTLVHLHWCPQQHWWHTCTVVNNQTDGSLPTYSDVGISTNGTPAHPHLWQQQHGWHPLSTSTVSNHTDDTPCTLTLMAATILMAPLPTYTDGSSTIGGTPCPPTLMSVTTLIASPLHLHWCQQQHWWHPALMSVNTLMAPPTHLMWCQQQHALMAPLHWFQ